MLHRPGKVWDLVRDLYGYTLIYAMIDAWSNACISMFIFVYNVNKVHYIIIHIILLMRFINNSIQMQFIISNNRKLRQVINALIKCLYYHFKIYIYWIYITCTFTNHINVHRVGISIAVHCNRLNTHLPSRFHNTTGNLTPVGDQYFGDGLRSCSGWCVGKQCSLV